MEAMTEAVESDRGAPSPRAWTTADWLAAHPGKRATERFWLLYTPIWGASAGAVMLTGAADRWSDAQLLPFALVLAACTLIGPVVLRPASERGIPLHRTAAVKLGAAVVGTAFLINYSQTPFFFDVLHMHYGFRTQLAIRDNPVALYVLTIPYFATYCVLCLAAYRRSRHALRRFSGAVQIVGAGMAPFAVAFLETAMNATPLTRHVFCYDDLGLVLWFGTFAYGTAFCCALPVWLHVDERPGRRVGLFGVAIGVLAAVYVDSLLLDVYRYHLAPHVTTVVEGARGLGDVPGSCLVPRPDA
jgi:hypothetical protein